MYAVYQRVQLRNDVREYLLSSGRGYSVILYEQLSAYLHPGEIFTCKMLDEAGISEYIYRQALTDADVFQRAPDMETGGRPAKRWYMPDRILFDAYEGEWYGQEFCPSDELPFWAYHSIKNYRLALHGAMIQREGEAAISEDGVCMTRGLQAQRLGVSAETVRRYDQLLEVEKTENIREDVILEADGDPYGNPDAIERFMDAVKNPDYGVWLLVDGIRTPVKTVIVNVARLAKAAVILCTQLPNKYKLRADWSNHYWNKISGYYDFLDSVILS